MNKLHALELMASAMALTPNHEFPDPVLVDHNNKPRNRSKSKVSKGFGETVYQGDGQYRPETIGRNEPCKCGSGKKYKKCCLK